MPIAFTAVADDDTGGTDLGGMLSERGIASVLILGEPNTEEFDRWSCDADAVIIGTASRSIEPAAAYERTRKAVQLLRSLSPKVLQIKYCSTFDSTPEGNIGNSIDAAMDEMDEKFTVALPALPVNGRTTYMGYHFVREQLVSDSSMRNHPLTPMTNSNLVQLLQSQTKRKVGLLSFPHVRYGPECIRRRLNQLRAEGVGIALIDCLSDEDLSNISEAISDLPLITGSSAPAMYLPMPASRTTHQPIGPYAIQKGRGFLVIAGSNSEATAAQNSWLAANGAVVLTLDARELADGATSSVPVEILDALNTGKTCLIAVSRDRGPVLEYFSKRNLTAVEVGERIAHNLAHFVRRVLTNTHIKGLIIAGGETSSTISRTVGFGALRIGRNVEPGVPLCFTLTEPYLPVVFKSGNFGSEDFYGRAIGAVESALSAIAVPSFS